MNINLSQNSRRLNPQISLAVAGFLAVWFALVVVLAATRALETHLTPYIAPLVALGIFGPTALYFAVPSFKAWVAMIGLRRLTLLHVWRIPAALAFFYYGARGELPPLFWILAGVGDLAAGVFAATLLWLPATRQRLLRIHAFGFTDFVVAVGTGLTYTLAHDPRMAPVRDLPMALIPLFGVGISGATHIMSLDLLRKIEGDLNTRTPSA